MIVFLNSHAMQTIKNKISIQVSDGTLMNAFITAPDDSNVHPGIILLQEAFGITSHIRAVAERIACEGYVVIAPELFHRTAPGIEFDQNNLPAVMEHVMAMKPDQLQSDLRACYAWLQQQDKVNKNKIGSIGFCMGGRASFVANYTLSLSACISYYGSGIQNMADKVKDLHAPHLFFWGGLDTHILPENVSAVVDAMKQGNKPYANVVFSYAGHAFNNDQRPNNYNSDASKEAWAISIAFLKNKLH